MKKISILLLVIVAALTSCKKVPEVNTEYVDVERDLITVGTTKATIQCDYEYIATLKKAFFHYGEGSDTTMMTSAEMRVVQKTLYVELSDLKENTTYSYYYEFANGFNSMRSATRTFKTEGSSTTITMPTVVTAEVTEITSNSAKSGGEVTNDGGAEVTERGICWSKNANPTLNDSHIASGTGTGVFTAMMSSLEANTTYHVRAYATNEKGTAYGLDREFTTLVYVPEGAINGLFTINDNGDKVYFSQGNLQYQASTNTWRFAENQWDYVGNNILGTVYENGVKCDNSLISSTYNGWIDLFGWGTSGWSNGNLYYQPFDYQFGNQVIAYGYGPTDGSEFYNLTNTYADADWGVYNSVVNGGNTPNIWRTLIFDEWYCLLFSRTTLSGNRFAKASINGTNGVVLFPDDWSTSTYTFNSPNSPDVPYYTNEITTEEWITIETNGAVFLPAAGFRHITTYSGGTGNYYGRYWTSESSHYTSSGTAYIIDFFERELVIGWLYRYEGISVRLVQDANK